jgi:hypothetical protein
LYRSVMESTEINKNHGFYDSIPVVKSIFDKDLSYTVCVQSVSFKLSSDFQ